MATSLSNAKNAIRAQIRLTLKRMTSDEKQVQSNHIQNEVNNEI